MTSSKIMLKKLQKNECNVFVAFIIAITCACYFYTLVPDGSYNLFHLMAAIVGFVLGYIVGLFALLVTKLGIILGIFGGTFYLVFFIFLPWLFQRSPI